MKILIICNSGLAKKKKTTSLRISGIWDKLMYENELMFFRLRAFDANEIYNVINDRILGVFSSALFLRRFYKQTKKFDLIIAESFKGALIALFFPFNIPFVWRQYGSTFGTELLNRKSSIKTRIKKYLYKKISFSKKCQSIIVTLDGCLNKTLYENMLKVPKNKMRYIYNPKVDIEASVNTNEKSNNKDEFVITQLGRITPWKKIHLTLKAIKKIIDQENALKIKFTIAGTISDKDYHNQLVQYIQNNELENYVDFKYDLDQNEVANTFFYSDVSISLTAYSPVIESLTMNTPVIIYNWGEVDEQFDDFENVEIIGREIRKESLLTQAEETQIVDELAEKIMEAYKKRHIKRNWERDNKLLDKRFPTLEESIEIGYQYYKEIIDKISGSESR